MSEQLGMALSAFDAALNGLRAALSPFPELAAALFDGTDEWRDLLEYKLAPHFAGEGCLVVAVAGGTNTGKSTVFNMLLGETASPVRATAAATCRPVVAGNTDRARQCLEGKLVPEFTPVPLTTPEAVLSFDGPENAMYVHETPALPDRLVFLDTPDIDSIVKRNWDVAEHIRAAGDVLVAVVTPEKYKDDRVIEFFQRAHAAGRLILPLMNKANPANDYAAARAQLADFCTAVGLEDAPLFALPYDFSQSDDPARPIPPLMGAQTLRECIEAVDVAELKRKVYRETLSRFVDEAGAFLVRACDWSKRLHRVRDDFRDRARAFSTRYDPAPGPEIGGLFHQFVQARRGTFGRTVGKAGGALARGAAVVGRSVRQAVFKRTALEAGDAKTTETDLRRRHRRDIERITQDLATSYLESARKLDAPIANIVSSALESLDVQNTMGRVADAALKAESPSADFRAHAERTLERWWNEHSDKRRVLLALDTILALVPAAIAIPLSLYVGGIGVPEAMIFAGPLMEQFFARVIEYQFGDALFDFLSPWRDEQRAALDAALQQYVAGHALRELDAALLPFGSGTFTELETWLEQCRTTLQTS